MALPSSTMTRPTRTSSPVGLHRVLDPAGVLPQAAWRLDTDPALAADEVRVRVDRLNLDAASFRQLSDKHGGDGDAVRAEFSRSSGPGARCTIRSPARAACSWAPSRRPGP